MYLNTKGFALPHGLGMGGDTENFRFFIPERFDDCTASTACGTFKPGTLAKLEFDDEPIFQLEALEVFFLFKLYFTLIYFALLYLTFSVQCNDYICIYVHIIQYF